MDRDAHHEHDEMALSLAGADADRLFELGMAHAAACSAPADLVVAHMCFNLAAAKGHREASQRRLEVAAEMSASEIAAAQRAARNWNATHCVVRFG
jgi:hypothetical protein